MHARYLGYSPANELCEETRYQETLRNKQEWVWDIYNNYLIRPQKELESHYENYLHNFHHA